MTEQQNRLTIFYQKAKADERLLPTHMALYLALYYLWHDSGYANYITIYRKELMPAARISSFVTYHKCMRELVSCGYIEYIPTYNYYKGSQVFFLSLA